VATLTSWAGHEYTAAAATRIHAAVVGAADAPGVVCVHGLGCSHRYFWPVARELAPAARVVAPDLPGFGRSPGPYPALDIRGLSHALADWLRATRRGGSLLLANSMGCQIVVDLASHTPDLLGPVVLAGPTVDRQARTIPQQWGRLLANQRWEQSSLGPVLMVDWVACGPRRYAQTLRHVLADPVERKLGHVEVTTIVARGGRDPIVPRAWADEVVAGLPQGRLAEVPGVGHTLNWSAPKELAALVRPLLAEVRA
jgi:pimeloyl-ACP methyl ester carboxylesterase